MKKRGAIQLSITTIIIIVLGIAILSLGLTWVYSIFTGVGDLTDDALTNARNQLNTLFGETTDTLVVSPSSLVIKQKEQKLLGIGIQNTITDGKKHNFRYKIGLVNKEGKNVNEVLSWISRGAGSQILTGETITLNSGQKESVLIPIVIPRNAPIGTYRFSVTLTADDPEGNSQANFILNVQPE